MKKFVLPFLISLVFINFSFAQQYQWTYVGALPSPSPAINSMSVVDENIIWVCCDAVGGAARLYKTVNGGTNWLLRNTGLPNVSLYGISALDTSKCWVGTVDGRIYYTSNGGFAWTLQLTVSGSFSNGIKMFNENYGVFYGDPTGSGQPYQFRVTNNGGTNWNLAPNAPVANNEFGVINAWDFIDTSRFWIGSANTVASSTNAKIYRTSTGYYGTWLSTVVNGTGGTSGCYFQTVGFTDANNGLVGSSGGDIRKTTDGGQTFTNVTPPAGAGIFSCMSMCGLKDASNTIRLATLDTGSTTKMWKTTNLGTTWIQENIPSAVQYNNVSHMQFLNSNLGFASTGSQSGGIGGLMKYGPSSGITNLNNNSPSDFVLEQNYPNPFNPSTAIKFSLPKNDFVTLKIYNALGKEVETLVNEFMPAGVYSVTFNASGLTSGLYFYKIITNNFVDTKKMLLVK